MELTAHPGPALIFLVPVTALNTVSSYVQILHLKKLL